jgi:hypothetical protein
VDAAISPPPDHAFDAAARSAILTDLTMASRTTLTAKNLELLGAARLAALLMDVVSGDAASKRRLRLELAADNPAELGKQIRKRLATLSAGRSFLDWKRMRALVADLEAQRAAIVDKLAKADPREALDLLWTFMDLADPVHERCDDSNGSLAAVFHQACMDLGRIATEAKPDPVAFADRIYEALIVNHLGQFDGLIAVSAGALGDAGLNHLKHRMLALSAQPVVKPPSKERIKIGWSMSGPIYADEIEESSRKSTVRMALLEIAEIQNDVDAYIAQHDEKTRRVPRIAVDIALRYLKADRAEEALATLDAADRPKSQDRTQPDFAWEDARIAVLDALGRGEEAQTARWGCFERSLSAPHLRAYLKKLPDFDDFEAEQRAMSFANTYPSRMAALWFFVVWPALDRAAKLVTANAAALDGDLDQILTPAAEALAEKHPLAATLALRAMIDFSLVNGRSSRYPHAAGHLRECASLASAVGDGHPFETHEAYVARLKEAHGRKHGFWSLVS